MIDNFGKYEEVAIGWDTRLEGFFFYCLESILDDDPEIWEIKITNIDLFEAAVEEAGIFLPRKIKNKLIEHSKINSQELLGYDLDQDTFS